MTKTLPEGYIQTDVQSGDSEANLQIIFPLERHPEKPILKRAVDPNTGWKGWVEYEEPVIEKPVDLPKQDFKTTLSLYAKKVELVNLKLFTEEELGIPALRDDLRSSFNEEWL